MEQKKVKKTEKIASPSKDGGNQVKTEHSKSSVLAVIRIHGEVKIKSGIVQTLDKLRLRKKYVCVLINTNNKSSIGMLKKVRFYVAYGEVEKETLAKLIQHRGKSIQGDNHKLKVKPEEAAEEVLSGKKLEDIGIKPFFRLHPPRKGIKSKLQYPKGVLGNNKQDINKLIERML